ncbi:non-ribosomal peptide synthetase [Burkholderia sp. LMG 21824]|uniref:non-ribosomal peptide synthetase n=1 Tax=Burkholderia sp. LMG 21824 TaxID=3158172 RepID=UPI003C2BBC0F
MISHDFDSARTLIPLLEQTAARAPEIVAVQDERRTLSFAALVSEIDALVMALRSSIAPGDHVAVRLPRGLEYVIAAYAIWKAGGVYVPLDDNWPNARIETILVRSNVRVLIHAGPAPAGMQVTALPRNPAVAPIATDMADMTAYLIHTSGTTGVPKAVQVGHASLLNLVANHQRYLYRPHGVTSGAVALNASFCFDSALERMALVALGYTVHVVADPVRKSPHALVQYLRDHQILNVDLVPSHLRVLMHTGLATAATALKLVIVGGEPIDAPLWQELAASRIAFFNVYGPTENTINTTFCRIQGTVPHIGRSFDGVDCDIVDADGRRCATGIAGELWISGRHLALGYYNAPDATAKAFVERDGVRYYRTGDIARIDDSGDLQFIGRLDDQVKINGHRFELADVQHHLACLARVREAAVTLIRRPDSVRLLATVVLEAGPQAPTFTELAAQLSARVPGYMVPENWQALDALPLTDNLKLDHKALLHAWERTQQIAGDIDGASDTWRASEREIRSVWQRVLARNEFALDDHFFASGGDSIAAMNLLVELGVLTSGEVELNVVFKHPTVRKMAAWLDTQRTHAATTVSGAHS